MSAARLCCRESAQDKNILVWHRINKWTHNEYNAPPHENRQTRSIIILNDCFHNVWQLEPVCLPYYRVLYATNVFFFQFFIQQFDLVSVS